MMPKWVIALGLIALLGAVPARFSHAQTTTPDSGKCPWKFPLYFSVIADAEEDDVMYSYDQKNGQYDIVVPPGGRPTGATISMEASIDTSTGQGQCTVSGDTLIYFRNLEGWFEANGTSGGGTEQLTIVFMKGQNRIKVFKYELDSSGAYHGRTSWSYSKGFEISNLSFDDSSIISSDSLLANHFASAWEISTSTQDLLSKDVNSTTSTDSISLSGIFRPVELFHTAAITQPDAILNTTIRVFPNPFSHSIQIAFSSENAGYADVSIVNLLGTEVAHLFSGELGAGEHRFAWNAEAAPPGMYECLIRLDGKTRSLPILLSR